MIRKIIFLLLFPLLVFAHGGEDHGEGKKATLALSSKYFSSEVSSDKYELLLKYETIEPGKEGKLKLFISDYKTNQPIDSNVQLALSISGNSNIKLTAKRVDKGVYDVSGVFPEKKSYNISVNINSPIGADLLLIQNIVIGKQLQVPIEAVEEHTHWYKSNWFFGIVGVLTGILLMFFIMRKPKRKIASGFIIFLCLFPTATFNIVTAHGGEEHGEGGSATSNTFSTSFLVEKESQFLFTILTTTIETADFNQSVQVLGTVIPSAQGKAVIQSPQAGKVVALKVGIGQRVAAGQTLAVIEQQVDAGTQINILSQRNSIDAEFNAAKAQYERLKSIEDIAAKKDVTEAKARYESALKNKQLFNDNAGRSVGNTKMITLTAPISGIVGTFNYSIGAVINAGETLFDITNLDKVLVEAQIFSTDAALISNIEKITTKSNALADVSSYALKLVSTAQSVNGNNQSQKAIFEIISPKSQFKIGENISINIFSNNKTRQIAVPNNAITEVNGKPVVFIKDKAENYSISYINQGAKNGEYTIVLKGVEAGERVVTTGVYQMKTIYLNQ